MLFKLHFFLTVAGSNALLLLLGVYLGEYTDASPGQLGIVYMIMPLIGVIFKPLICSIADRHQNHREAIIFCQLLVALSFLPFVIVPYLGADFYKAHARFCWYSLVTCNIIGDIAYSGVVSLGDSLAANYAKRVNTNFGTYRVWGSISWMVFGLVGGQLNEASFLPKYVAAFMILVLFSALDAFVCFLWPGEYFVMVMTDKRDHDEKQAELSWWSMQKRSLLARELVWAHSKDQFCWLITCGFWSPSKRNIDTGFRAEPKEGSRPDDAPISKRVQLQTLLLVVRRDPRVILYYIVLVGGGASLVATSFFLLFLADRCNTQKSCNFSQLAGYMQFAMGLVDPLVFLCIEPLLKSIGRLNVLTLAFALGFSKFLFYATIWAQVDPRWALVSELVDGVLFVVYLVMQVELSHLFAGQVRHLIPELIERGVIDANDEKGREKLKLALPATMLALLASAREGLGKGLGALAYGIIVDAYSYNTLWIAIAVGTFCFAAALQAAAMFQRCLGLRMGLEHLDSSETDKVKPSSSDLGQNGNKIEKEATSVRSRFNSQV